MKKQPGAAPMPVCHGLIADPYTYEYGLDEEYEEYDTNILPMPKTNWLLEDHQCQGMINHENERNAGKHWVSRRKFVIKHTDGGWKLFDNDSEYMAVVQCPFCYQHMFVGNQVTIE
jgi:hypothetical protein